MKRKANRCRALLLVATTLAAAPVHAQHAPATVKPIAFTERTLANGLRVYAIRDTTTPNVAIQVWYDVGSKDDPKGRSGFAHMFEHLMFKATRNLASEQMDRLTEDVGGYNNASTDDDYTDYFEVVPANHLAPLLFAEADRMSSLVVEPTSFNAERAVVEEELRQSTLSRPYGKLFSVYLSAASYARHPYARSTIGSIPNLDSASIDDVRAFHATYYRPDNAILVVSGNFDPAQLNGWVDQYFAGIGHPTTAIPRVTVTEPLRTRAASYTVYEPNTPLPAVAITYHVPPDRDADIPALTVLQAILATGESSRLYEDLVYRDGLAQDAAANLDTKKGTGTLIVYAIMAGGKTAAAGETALRREVARFRDTVATPAELARATNQILTEAIRSRETAEGKARTIATSVIVDGDPHASDRQLAAIATVTAADVQRVARTYLGDDRSVTIHYLPTADRPAGATGDTIAVGPDVVVADLRPPASVPIVVAAGPADRVAPPAVGPIVVADLPHPVETTLSNGLRLVVVERHDLPLVTATLIAGQGAALDPPDRSGTASLTATLLTKGTTTRSATDIARAIAALGGTIASDADRDGASVDVTVKSDQLAPALTILADVAQHSVFAPAEIARARAQAIDAVTIAMKDPAQLAGLVAARVVFGDSPYGAPVDGTPTSLAAIARGDIVRAYARTWRPSTSTLVMVGDVTLAAARTLADQRFAHWPGGNAVAVPARVAAVPFPAPRVIVIDVPDAGQAAIVVARPGIARGDQRYYPLTLANTILGGGFSSRLNEEIRIKRGLAYGASSKILALRNLGIIAATTQTKNSSAAEVVALILDQMIAMGVNPASPDELQTRKAVLIGNFGRTIETTNGLASLLGTFIEQNLLLDELQHYTASVRNVDSNAEQSASITLLDPSTASIIIAGNSKQFIGSLRNAHSTLTVVPVANVNLGSSSLK